MPRALWSLRHRTQISVRRSLLALLNWLSLSWTVAMASLQGLIRSKAVFMRTPKERDEQSLWTAIRDARTETLLALLLWGAGIAVAVSGAAQPFLLVLFAWQGLVYAARRSCRGLNVRTVLTPQLERRRRTELRRERAAALAPYYAGAAAATVAVGLVLAILFLGGSRPGTPPQLELPHRPPAAVNPNPGSGVSGTPSSSVSPSTTPAPEATATGPGTTTSPQPPSPAPATTAGSAEPAPTSTPGAQAS